ncbi:Ig domain-containing protein [Paenibacillus chartarius]|uniref:Ig domain-containing protein n=1 Tax=Paenibacillus chartarius TaxID=747481 RepID=A0ABV6DUF7_9BACL
MLRAQLSCISRLFLVLIVAAMSFVGQASVTQAETPNNTYKVVASVPGTILDFDLNRILYSSNGVLYIRNLATSADDKLPTSAATKGALTDNGAVYIENSNLYTWSNKGYVNMFMDNVGQLFEKSRNFVAFTKKYPSTYSPPSHIGLFYLRTNGAIMATVFNGHGTLVDEAGVSNDGHLIYRSQYNDFLIGFHNYVTTSTPHRHWEHPKYQDGIQIIYPKLADPIWEEYYLTRYTTDGKEQDLVRYRHLPPPFAVNNGWTAYSSNEDGIVILSPEGNKYTYPLGRSLYDISILHLSDTGEAIIQAGLGSSPEFWFISPGSEKVLLPNNLSSDMLKTPFWKLEDGKYYCFKDDTLYQFTPHGEHPANVPLVRISLDAPPMNVLIYQHSRLQPVFYPANATNQKVTWRSNDPNIAIVDGNGIVTGISKGSTQIVATSEEGQFTASQTVQVNNAEGIVSFVFSDYSREILNWVYEGNGYVEVPVYRTGGSNGELTVRYTTRTDTAKEDSDFALTKGIIRFKHGQSYAKIYVRLFDDSTKESLESFSLKLTGPSKNINELGSTIFFVINDND